MTTLIVLLSIVVAASTPATVPVRQAGTNPSRPPSATRTSAAQKLEARVAAYWRLRQAKDLARMYDFYASGYRSAHTRSEFQGLTRLVRFDILSFEVASHDVAGGKAKVTVRYRCRAPQMPRPFDAEATEEWVREGRTWFKQDEPLLLPFPPK